MASKVRSLTYIGVGNIGSHAAFALARLPKLGRLTLVDPDVYEFSNLSSQAIERRDVGCRKVDVLARRIRGINPALHVVPIAERVENVPLGRLRADVIASGLDSRVARLSVNRVAKRLGAPWVDAGVRAEGHLVRVDVFGPSPDEPCCECGWGAEDYATVEQTHPCNPLLPTPAPTDAPAYLGGLAAALQAGECDKLLGGEAKHALFGRQLLFDTTRHRHYVSVRRRAADCRFDHQIWRIEPLARTAGAISLRQALRLAPSSRDQATQLRLEGHAFVRRLSCLGCGDLQRVLCLASHLDERARGCRRCGSEMVASGFDTVDTLSLEDCAGQRPVSLFAIGMRAGDVFSIEWSSGERQRHFEIGG